MTPSNAFFPRFCRALADWEWLFLALMLPFVLAPTPQRALVLLATPVLWTARKVGYGRFFTKTPLDWPIWGVLAMVLVSLYASDDWRASLPKIVGVCYGVAIFYAAAAYAGRRPRQLWWGVGALLACGLLVVGAALLGVRWTSKFNQLDPIFALMPERLLAISPDDSGISPNEVAGVLLWILPLGLTLSLGAWRYARVLLARWGKLAVPAVLFVWTATVAMLVVMILTQSRAGLAGLAAGSGLMALLAVARFRWWLAVALLLLVIGGSTAVWQTKASPITAFAVEHGGARNLETLQGRVEIWGRAIYAIQDFPLTGMGMNRFRVLVFDYYPTFFLPRDSDFAHAHNHLLQAGLDLGLPGLIFYTALWLNVTALAWLAWQRAATVWQRLLGLGILCSLAAYFVYGLVDAVALGARPGFIFWLLLGIAAALHAQLPLTNRCASAANHVGNGS